MSGLSHMSGHAGCSRISGVPPKKSVSPRGTHPVGPSGRFHMARSATASRISIPLGSLTQRDAHAGSTCVSCSSARITQLAMNLTDGTPVDFVSCHVCGHRSWSHEGVELAVTDVLERTRKIK